MRAGAGAAVGVVAELMDMHAPLGIGVVTGDVPADGRWGGLGGLLEGHLARDLGVSSDDGDCGGREVSVLAQWTDSKYAVWDGC